MTKKMDPEKMKTFFRKAATVDDAASKFKVTKATVRKHLADLVKAGVVAEFALRETGKRGRPAM